MSRSIRFILLLSLLVSFGLLVYRSVLVELALDVLNRSDASHGVFVPLIAGYLVWRSRGKMEEIHPRFSAIAGAGVVGGGLILFLVSAHMQIRFTPALSFLIVTAGLIVALYGKSVLKLFGFPLFFLATMIPIPKDLYQQLAEGMRMATTWGSVRLLQTVGFPIHRDGYSVTIPNLDLFVAISCSGIRYLIPYFVFGLAYAYLTRPTMAGRFLVVLATVPMSIFAGVMRQSLVFLSAYYIGPFMADHRPHVMISWFVFVTVLVGTMCLDQRLRSGGPPRDEERGLTSPVPLHSTCSTRTPGR
jgi:exosortase